MSPEVPVSRRNRKLLVAALALLLLIIVVSSAAVVVRYSGIDDLEAPGLLLVGDDSGPEAPTAHSGQPDGQDNRNPAGDHSQGTPSPAQVSPSIPREDKLIDIKPSPGIVTLNGPGQSQPLTVQGLYSDGNISELVLEPGEEFFFASSDASVARVSSDGIITSLEAGGADVLVAYRDYEVEVPVLVWGEIRQIPAIDPEAVLPIDDDGTAIVLNRVMVELEPDYRRGDAEELAASIGGEVIFEYRTIRGYIVEIPADTKNELQIALDALDKDSRVTAAYPDMLVPSDQGADPRTYVETLDPNKDDRVSKAYREVGLDGAWDIMNRIPNPKAVIVAIIDDGFIVPPINPVEVSSGIADVNDINDSIMEAFPPIYNIGDPRENTFYEPSGKGIYVVDLIEGENRIVHGTAVASVMVAENNIPSNPRDDRDEVGHSGIISSVLYIDFTAVIYAIGQTIDPNSLDESRPEADIDCNIAKDERNCGVNTALNSLLGSYNAFEALEPYADQVDVVNVSVSVKCPKDKNGEYCGPYHTWKNLMAKMSNIVFVVSAGNKNEAIETDDYVRIPAGFSDLPNVITVGGTGDGGIRYINPNLPTIGSNFGDRMSLAAPWYVYSAWAQWYRIPDRDYQDTSEKHLFWDYGELGGTSYSTPLVAGTAALLRAINPDLPAASVKDLLVDEDSKRQMVQPEGSTVPMLNAQEAVEDVISAEIIFASGSWNLATGHLDVQVSVDNTGFVEWSFLLQAVEDGTETVLYTHAERLVPVREYGSSIGFNFSLAIAHDTEVELRLYRFPNGVSKVQSRKLVIPVPDALLRPDPTEVEGAPAQSMASADCLPNSVNPVANSQTRGQLIEVENFQKPSEVTSAMLMFTVNNRVGWSGTFYVKKEILSHPGQFSWFNDALLTPLRIQSGDFVRLAVAPNPNEYEHPQSGKREFDLRWEKFNYDCELEIRISVYADEGETRLLDYVTIREKIEPFRSNVPASISDPGIVATPLPYPVSLAEVSAKARELKERLDETTDPLIVRYFSGKCTGVISELQEMLDGLGDLHTYPTNEAKMAVLERIELMLDQFLPKWEGVGCF